eukprot:m.214116 g.214116  ORF g.214116 m.214116 type:complete len:373 (-) comp19070_c0_seq1:1298-2416(-)
MEKSEIVDITIDGFEKRRDGGKHYVYRIKVKYASKKVDVIWRRYRQFDALKSTIDGMLATVKETEALPKLTPKKYIGRSSIRHVADVRKPRLQAFLTGVLEHAQNDPKMMTTLTFFLTPTTADKGAKLVSATGGDDSDSDADDGSHGAELQGVVIQAHVDGRHQQALSAGAVVRVGADDLSHPFHRPDGVFVDARLPCGTRGLVRLSAVDLSEVHTHTQPHITHIHMNTLAQASKHTRNHIRTRTYVNAQTHTHMYPLAQTHKHIHSTHTHTHKKHAPTHPATHKHSRMRHPHVPNHTHKNTQTHARTHIPAYLFRCRGRWVCSLSTLPFGRTVRVYKDTHATYVADLCLWLCRGPWNAEWRRPSSLLPPSC